MNNKNNIHCCDLQKDYEDSRGDGNAGDPGGGPDSSGGWDGKLLEKQQHGFYYLFWLEKEEKGIV